MTARWFGEYEIVQRLRVGGMATLYLARRHGAAGFSRLVALKMIDAELAAQPGFVEMFVDEARICSQISHPNVVHVEEFGVIDGVHYLVMEHIDGCSIGDLLQGFRHDRRTLDPELVARIIAQIAGGLHAAHETRDQDGKALDIIHRDISPSNVLLSVTGNPKLIDFGIAKARNRRAVTQSGVTLKGKYRYVAPEQARRAVVDRRSDVFSLGVVFWEMLVGRPLFSDDSPASLVNRLNRTEVPPPSAVNPAVPTILDPIVMAMLEHEPDQRLQTAAEVERRIVAAAPGAANREASELGAIAVEIRDRRARWLARRNARDAAASDPPMFPPTLRSVRTQSHMHGIVAAPEPSQHELSPAAVPPPKRDRLAVRLAIAILFVVGMIGGVLVGQDRAPPDAATVPHDGRRPAAHAPEARKQVEPHGPVDPSPSPSSPPSPPRPPTAPLAGQSAAPAPAAGIPIAAPSSTRRDGLRAPRPPQRRADEGSRPAAQPSPPAARGPAIIRDFDERADSAPGEVAPATGKRPPIVPRFDH